METILNAIRDEIKKVSSEEKINAGKLTELIHIYRRIEAYTITSVNQVHPVTPLFDPDGYGAFPVLPPVRNETATLYDGIIKSFQEMYKAQTPDVSGIRILRYIDWYKFLNETPYSYKEPNQKQIDILYKLKERILNDIEKELNEKDKTDEVKTKLYEHIVGNVKKEIENQENENKEKVI